MSGISDQFTTIGNEAVAWGTAAATLTRGIEAKPGNKPTHRVEHRPSSGFRPGYIGDPTDTHVVDSRGGTYPLVCDLLSKSHSLLLGSVGSSAITTPGGGTNSRIHTITPSDYTIPSRSIHDAVLLEDGTLDHIQYLGGKATSIKFGIASKGNVEITTEFDFKSVNTAASSVSPAYPSSPYVYRDTNVTTTLGGAEICQRNIDVTIPTGAKIDRDMICPGGREEPVSVGRIQPTGTLTVDFASVGFLDDFLAGTPRALSIVIDSGVEIETGQNFKVTLTFPVVRFTGDAPERSLTDLTTQALPWQAFDNGTDPLWKIEYQTSDTAA